MANNRGLFCDDAADVADVADAVDTNSNVDN